jgi:hypothetical protein
MLSKSVFVLNLSSHHQQRGRTDRTTGDQDSLGPRNSRPRGKRRCLLDDRLADRRPPHGGLVPGCEEGRAAHDVDGGRSHEYATARGYRHPGRADRHTEPWRHAHHVAWPDSAASPGTVLSADAFVRPCRAASGDCYDRESRRHGTWRASDRIAADANASLNYPPARNLSDGSAPRLMGIALAMPMGPEWRSIPAQPHFADRRSRLLLDLLASGNSLRGSILYEKCLTRLRRIGREQGF